MVVFIENRYTTMSPIIRITSGGGAVGEKAFDVFIEDHIYYTGTPDQEARVYFGGTGATPVWESTPRAHGEPLQIEVPRSMWFRIAFESTTPAPTVTVTGTVTSSFTGLPLTFALVDINGKTANTAADGKYTLQYPDPFSSTVTVSLAGYVTFADVITTEATGITTYDVQLEPVSAPPPEEPPPEEPPPAGKASLFVNSSPEGASIFLGPSDTGEVTPHTFTLDPASYGVGFQLDGYLSGFQSVTLSAGDSKTAFHAFEQLPSGPVPPEKQYPYTAPSNWLDQFSQWYYDLVNWLPQYGTETPDSMVNSAIKIFTGKEPTTGNDAIIVDQDYANLALVIAGAAYFSKDFIRSMVGKVGIGRVVPQLSQPQIVETTIESGVARGSWFDPLVGAYIKSNPIWGNMFIANLRALPFSQKIFMLMGGGFLLTQLDGTGWFFGLSPEAEHRKVETALKQMRGDLIRLDQLVKAGMWKEAGDVVAHIRINLKFVRERMSNFTTTFWSTFGFTMDDMEAMFDTLESELESYLSQYPAIEASLVDYLEIYTQTVTEVIDGDTIMLDDELKVRMLGIDAHEIGTTAGQVEKDTLSSWILDKEVVRYVDPLNQIDRYGRVLAVIVLDGVNINLKMLKTFGEYILPPAKYHDRNKYVDWDENKLVAKSMELPIAAPVAVPTAEDVGSLNITSSPTYAEIRIDGAPTGLKTAETIENIPVGKYRVSLVKDGYLTNYRDVDIIRGRRTEVNIILPKAPEVEVPTKLTRSVIEDFYKRGVLEEPTARLELAELEYTPEDIDRFIDLWTIELQQAAKPAEEVELGRAWVSSYPYYASIWVDGVDTGHLTAETVYGLSPGMHTIQLKYPDWQFEPIVFSIAAGEKKEFFQTGHYIG